MKKLNLADFCKAESTYAQLIQNLFLHISVRKMYLILMADTAEKGDVYQSVTYRKTYEKLEKMIPDFERMSVGEALRFATVECLSNKNISGSYDEDMIRKGYQIVKALLVDLFQPYAERNRITYKSVLAKMEDAACAADGNIEK